MEVPAKRVKGLCQKAQWAHITHAHDGLVVLDSGVAFHAYSLLNRLLTSS